jgi:hypothetical protein
MQLNKNEQLGMSFGKASNRLKKNLLFSLAVRLNLHLCFQCGEEIRSPEEMSVEHKQPWLNSENPVELFFSLDNIAFSHLKCNVAAARPAKKYETEEERIVARQDSWAASKRRKYTPEARHAKYLDKGY